MAALKLIELMSIVQLEEFYTNQWVFIFDYFGLTIEPNAEFKELIEDTSELGTNKTKISSFDFQPYMPSCMLENYKIDYQNKTLQDQTCYAKINRKIVMDMTKVILLGFETYIKI